MGSNLNQNLVRVRNRLCPSSNKDCQQFVFKPLHDRQLTYLTRTLGNVILKGQTASLFLIGPTSSGKSTLVERALQAVVSQGGCTDPGIVKLNGKVCKNFRVAVESLFAQLGAKGQIEDLLDTKSHFDERISEIFQLLRGHLQNNRTLVIILDNIDFFCHQQGQALLYNLLDAVQARQAPICVLGITTRQDILEMLEKRVKSRFSHRIVNLEEMNLNQFVEASKNLLSCEDEKWNEEVQQLFSKKSVQIMLEQLLRTEATIGYLTGFLYSALLNCNEGPTESCIRNMLEKLRRPAREQQIMDCNFPELILVASIARHMKNGNGNPMFKLDNIYEIAKGSLEHYCFDKEDLIRSLKSLEIQELVSSVDKKNNKVSGYFKLEISPLGISDAFKDYPGLPSEITRILL